MAVKLSAGASRFALMMMVVPLATLVPVAVPFGAAQVAGLAALGQADAATVKKAKRKVVVRKPVAVTKVCTTARIKGKRVKRCAVAGPVTVAVLPVSSLSRPNPVTPLPYVPVPVPPPPAPIARQYAPPQLAESPIAYYWIDQADSYAQAVGNSPPDFSFDCNGVQCWAWISREGEVLIVEPGRDGVLQYFFGPRQTSPYLARDSYSSFAFDGRDLVQVYDSRGRLYSGGFTSQARYDGQALQQRGRSLFAASLRQRRWDRGSATAWSYGYSSLGYDDGWNSGWSGAWRELPEWDRYEGDRRRQHPPRHLDSEHRDRDEARRRYDDWHRRGDQGAPPLTGNPVVTPSDDAGPAAPPPPRGPRPGPPPPPPLVQPQPQVQPPLVAPPEPVPVPVADVPVPVPSDAEPPRRERPRREIQLEPDAPPVPMRRTRPVPQQAPEPVAEPGAGPVRVPPPVPEPVYAPPPPPPPPPEPDYTPPPPPPAPAPEPQRQAPPPPEPAPVPAPAPAPAPVPVPAAAPAPAPAIAPAPPAALPPAPAPPPPPPPKIQVDAPVVEPD